MIRLILAMVLALLPFAAQSMCRADSVEVRTPGGMIAKFRIEVADTEGTRALGLMHRTELPKSAGMLFVYPRPLHATFWMKNTLIPLDMLFADASGLVTRVHKMARPLDETVIDGGRNVQFVLEINGGLAQRMGLVEGSVLRHPAIDPGVAVWPCE